MVPEATLDDLGSGLQPSSEGWFVVNVRDAAWITPEEDFPTRDGRHPLKMAWLRV